MALTETIVAFTDCINLQESNDEVVCFDFSNKTDFAGIVYNNFEPVLSICVHAQFYEEREPEENESEEMPDSSIVKLSSETKFQRLLEVEPASKYFHTSLKLALQHNYIFDGENQWEKEEAYEQAEIDKRNLLKTAQVWLTKKVDSVFTNVFGE